MFESFLERLLMTIRFQGVNLFFGLAMAFAGAASLVSSKPLPSDSAFEAPLPYDLISWVAVVFGIFLTLRAIAKAPR